MTQAAAIRRPGGLWGRPFVHPLFDVMIIGGGLSLLVCAAVMFLPEAPESAARSRIPYLILFCNSAHFAASTVRLYAKPGACQALPFLTLMFPVVSLAALTLAVVFASSIGSNLYALHLTWSPYHYAAQAYGLAVMYSFRSGCLLDGLDKKLLWWVSMLPFFFVFLTAESDAGLAWLLPRSLWMSQTVVGLRSAVTPVFYVLVFVTPLLLAVKAWRSKSGPLPLISLLVVVTNGIWFLVMLPQNAFVWATIFHGLQYLAIVAIFHWKDQAALPGNTRGPIYHTVRFYLLCLGLGYALFNCLPHAYRLAGFGFVESVLVVAAAINVHHFIVDAYIWRLKKTDGNRQIVDSSAPRLDPDPVAGRGVMA